ncbi:MAG TPA: hypothetical protein PK819_01915 [Thermomicrobiales bacterium]|nr:hypothetical protein [Thermomicrobiales bacterium]
MPTPITLAEVRRSRDFRIASGFIVLSILLVAGLWLLARNAPSSVQKAQVALDVTMVSGEEGCTNFAEFWMDPAGAGVAPEAISKISNCRQDAEGNWYRPSGSVDARLTPAERLTPVEAEAVAPLQEQLLSSLSSLQAAIPRSLQQALGANYDPVNQPVFGHTRKGAPAMGDKRTRYIRITRAFLISPDNVALADYVAWLMDRRQTASDAFLSACTRSSDLVWLQRACNGIPGEFQVGSVPLLWDLQDPVLIQEFLIDRVRSGEPLPLATPSTAS